MSYEERALWVDVGRKSNGLVLVLGNLGSAYLPRTATIGITQRRTRAEH